MWPPRKKAAFLHRWRPSLIGTGTRPLDSPDRRCSRQNFYGSVNHFTLCLILPAVCLNQVERGDAVSENVALAVYAACGFLIVVYAWGRSHAKPCNLAITLLAYLALGGPLFAQAAALTHQLAGGLTATGRIAHVQLLTIGMVVSLMQRQAYLTPAPGEPPRFSAQIANSLIAVVTAGGICFVFHSGTEDPVIGTGHLVELSAMRRGSFLPRSLGPGCKPPRLVAPRRSRRVHICNGTRDWLALLRRTVSFPAPSAPRVEACRPVGDDEHDRPDDRRLCAGSFSRRSSYGGRSNRRPPMSARIRVCA